MLTIPDSQKLTSQVVLEMPHFHSWHCSPKPAKILQNHDYLMGMFSRYHTMYILVPGYMFWRVWSFQYWLCDLSSSALTAVSTYQVSVHLILFFIRHIVKVKVIILKDHKTNSKSLIPHSQFHKSTTTWNNLSKKKKFFDKTVGQCIGPYACNIVVCQ